MKWQASDRRVQSRHVRFELPERVDEQNRIVPSVLPCSISGSTCFHVNILPNSRMKGWVNHNSSVWNKRHGEIRVIVRGYDRASRYFFLRLSLSAPVNIPEL